MANHVDLVCAHCGLPFRKAVNEYNRRVGKNPQSKFYCSLRCSGFGVGKHRDPSTYTYSLDHLVSDNRRDSLTPYRWFVARTRARSHRRYGAPDIDALYLSHLWQKQKGKCLFTQWDLILPDSTSGWSGGRNPRNASLDRIDNQKGYIEDNVRFVCLMANTARGPFSDQELLDFCAAVSKPR